MKLTLAMILYFIRDMDPVVCEAENKTENRTYAYAGVKQFFAEDEEITDDYLYVCDLALLWMHRKVLRSDMTVLAAENAGLTEEERSQISCNLILVDETFQPPYILNRMIQVFGRLANWDKSMHIAALEGKPLQELVDLSEAVLKHPILVFDAGFDVLGYSKSVPEGNAFFAETVEHGYTAPKAMEQMKKLKLLSRLESGEPLVAPAAGDESKFNIYLSFYNGKKLLGYAAVFCDESEPEEGYLDILKYFMSNLTFCLKRDYDKQRYGQMMYETFLVNLMNPAGIAKEQIQAQLEAIDHLTQYGRFVLGVFSFTDEEQVPIDFVARILEQNMWDVKVYIYEEQICLLRILEKDAVTTPVIVESETRNIKALLANYEFLFGISNVFYDISDLRYAHLQAVTAMRFGKREGKQFCVYRDYYYHHMFSLLDEVMPIEHLKSEVYQQLSMYDETHHTSYRKMLMTYLACDCNATHAAQKLFVHRNTIRNAVQFVEEKWKIDLGNLEEKKRLSLAAMIDAYKELYQ